MRAVVYSNVLPMQRRDFLFLSAVAPVWPYAPSWLGAFAARPGSEPPKRSVLVRDHADRSNEPFKFLDATFFVKVSGKDTEGRCVIFDTLRPAKVGPVLHTHHNCDEWFQVLEGEFKFQAGEEFMRLKAGDTLLVPRDMQHAFVKTSEGTARLIVMHQPAGTMEEFFRTASKMADQSQQARQALAEAHDIHYVGPPLTPD
ncbi:cupin domain-containing protein [Hymenobacter sp. GOD-10R]|uniref:cupin domain-containing protein n=1 Tax=Hymenobacter sp. GOD-10R TaxID=3093922 RepID=UPI002D788A3A|nr:cupin domain-containing protein [Hymenobacter sp. GOD-10R]WRQ26267.1 cupin domain-containing protein [Hymenobacter sp. GOD-10R]